MIGDPFFEQTRFELTHAALSSGGSPRYEGTFAYAYLSYLGGVFASPFNIVAQTIQGTLFWRAGSPLHQPLSAALMFEFVTGAPLIALAVTAWDPDDKWSEENAIWGFHGVGQTGYGKASKEFNPMIEGVGWPHDQYS